MNIDDAISAYITNRSLKRNTELSFRNSLKGFSFDNEKNSELIVALINSDCSQSTKRLKLKAIKAFFKFAHDVLHIDIENPVAGIRIKDGNPRTRIPTDQELSDLIEVTDKTTCMIDSLYVRLLILTGARCSSIETIRPCDMDELWRLSIFNQKLDRRYSVSIPITDTFTRELWHDVTKDMKNNDMIFDHLCHERLSRRMKSLFKKDENGESLTPHSIRHGFATRLINAGVPIKTACTILDTSITVMLHNYVTVKQSDIDNLFNTVSQTGKTAKKKYKHL